MTSPIGERTRVPVVVIFAIAMAWVEAACVFNLRVLVDRIDPYQANPLPFHGVLGQIELAREAATLVMLATLGLLAGRTRYAQVGYTAIAFGVWDIFYYVFLRIMGSWPRSPLDWDILFLLPLPWWGPVIAPVLIALLQGLDVTTVLPTTFKWPLFSVALVLMALPIAIITVQGFQVPLFQRVRGDGRRRGPLPAADDT